MGQDLAGRGRLQVEAVACPVVAAQRDAFVPPFRRGIAGEAGAVPAACARRRLDPGLHDQHGRGGHRRGGLGPERRDKVGPAGRVERDMAVEARPVLAGPCRRPPLERGEQRRLAAGAEAEQADAPPLSEPGRALMRREQHGEERVEHAGRPVGRGFQHQHVETGMQQRIGMEPAAAVGADMVRHQHHQGPRRPRSSSSSQTGPRGVRREATGAPRRCEPAPRHARRAARPLQHDQHPESSAAM